MRLRHTTTAMALCLMATGLPAWADMEAAKAFLDTEIAGLSVLDRPGQEAACLADWDRTRDLAKLDTIIREHERQIRAAWADHFGS